MLLPDRSAGAAVWKKHEGTLDRLLAYTSRADLVVLDEFGYVPIDVDGARLLFQVTSDYCLRRSKVLTANVEFSRWGPIFADDELAAAIASHGGLAIAAGPATGSRSLSCSAGQETGGVPAPETEKPVW